MYDRDVATEFYAAYDAKYMNAGSFQYKLIKLITQSNLKTFLELNICLPIPLNYVSKSIVKPNRKQKMFLFEIKPKSNM